MSQTNSERISSRPEVCGGKACIADTRIRVQDIYVLEADEMAKRAEFV